MNPPPVEGDSGNLADAARYVLLRRLAPAIRHRLVGALHPIGMIAEAIEGCLQTAAPDLANAGESLGKLKHLSRSAVMACTNSMTWLAPDESAVIMLGEGIDECLGLLNTDFATRGFAVENEAQEIGIDVSRPALRTVLTASLIAATDAAPYPADLMLADEVSQGYLVLSILVRPAARDAIFFESAAYRRLEWKDVEALAVAESVGLTHSADCVTMQFRVMGDSNPASLPP